MFSYKQLAVFIFLFETPITNGISTATNPIEELFSSVSDKYSQSSKASSEIRVRPSQHLQKVPRVRSFFIALWNSFTFPWRVRTTVIDTTDTDDTVVQLVYSNSSMNSSKEVGAAEEVVAANATIAVISNSTEALPAIDDKNVTNSKSEKSTRDSTTADENTTASTTQDPGMLGTSSKPQRKLKPEVTPNCEKFTESELYHKLERIGGRNQQFMANTPEEAGRNFADTISMHEDENRDDMGMLSDAIYGSASEEDECVSTCKEITRKLNEEIKNGNYAKDFNANKALFDHGPVEVQEGKAELIKGRNCFLEQFVQIGNCTPRGEEELWGYEKLCSACHGVYMLSKECFPRFLNAVICDGDDGMCIFDRINRGHGRCQIRTLSFKVLKNRGSAECEEWVSEHIEVPIACECFLDRSSSLLSATEL